MRDRYVVSDEKQKILYIDANNFYGWTMSQMLPYDEIEMWHGHLHLYLDKLKDFLYDEDDSMFGFFDEVHLKFPDNMEQKTKNFPFAPERNWSTRIYE